MDITFTDFENDREETILTNSSSVLGTITFSYDDGRINVYVNGDECYSFFGSHDITIDLKNF